MTAKRLLPFLLIAAWIAGVRTGVRADLYSYLQRPELAYHWEKRGERRVEGGTIVDLHLVSQTWQDIVWEHRLQVFRPDNLRYTDFCGLYNTGGNGSSENEAMGMLLARASQANYAILYGIPKQPLYGGKTEDALVVYTWLKYLQTGDDSWPLHFPMAKAVLKAMDAIQDCAGKEGWRPIRRFLVTGASKRGWTTWLVGASKDPRVKAIAPMVIDTLNVAAQIPHQLEMFSGSPSSEIDDYTNAGLLQRLRTPEGQRLLKLEDPYSYREVLTLPKLILLGTNDPYWAQDALNIYWDDLRGPKWVMYAPNSGHGLDDRKRVYATLSAFIRTVASGKKWPVMHWSYAPSAGGATLALESNVAPTSARLFRANSATRDFRKSRWSSEETPVSKQGFSVQAEAPKEGYSAVYGEATYDLDGQPFTLSTQIRILSPSK